MLQERSPVVLNSENVGGPGGVLLSIDELAKRVIYIRKDLVSDFR